MRISDWSSDVCSSDLIPEADSLYFTMLNHNKRSITLDTKNPKGKQVLETLIKECDVLVENFAPGALDRMGFTWERIHELNRSEERRVGKECVSTCRSRWPRFH